MKSLLSWFLSLTTGNRLCLISCEMTDPVTCMRRRGPFLSICWSLITLGGKWSLQEIIKVFMIKILRNPITVGKIKIDSIDISTAVFDSALSPEAFVNSICKSALLHLFTTSSSRRYLTDAAKIRTQDMSKIDYCNNLLYGLADKLLNRIQRIQNYASRLVPKLHKFSQHITPALATLHRPTVNRREDFKIALLVHKALNGQAQLISEYSCSPTIHTGSCAQLTNRSFSQSPWHLKHMMTSSNENIFRVTDHLCGEFTCHRNSQHKGRWRRALMFSLICAWINGWINNREAGDLRRHRAHYDVIVMSIVIVISAVQPQLYDPISITAWSLPKLLMPLK